MYKKLLLIAALLLCFTGVAFAADSSVPPENGTYKGITFSTYTGMNSLGEPTIRRKATIPHDVKFPIAPEIAELFYKQKIRIELPKDYELRELAAMDPKKAPPPVFAESHWRIWPQRQGLAGKMSDLFIDVKRGNPFAAALLIEDSQVDGGIFWAQLADKMTNKPGWGYAMRRGET